MRPGLAWLLPLLAACAAIGPDPEASPLPSPALPGETAQPPPGFGTLRQEQFSLELRDGAVILRATPLEEQVLRLAAPDTYRRLHALAEQQRAAERAPPPAGGGAAAPVVFLVSFSSREEGVAFQPGEVLLESGGRILRPQQVTGLTPGWGEQRLRPQQPQMAVYAFAPELDLSQPFLLRYGTRATDAWREILPLLQEERSRVLARAAGGS